MIKSFEIGKGNNNTKDQTLEDVRSLFKDGEDYSKKTISNSNAWKDETEWLYFGLCR